PGGTSGSRTILGRAGGSSRSKISATSRAYFSPAASLSGRMQTSRPARGVQSDFTAADDPCADVTAGKSSSSARSPHPSPSTTYTRTSAGSTSDLYSGHKPGGSPIVHTPLSSRCTGRNSLSCFLPGDVGTSNRATRAASPGYLYVATSVPPPSMDFPAVSIAASAET